MNRERREKEKEREKERECVTGRIPETLLVLISFFSNDHIIILLSSFK
jgi:hypothetical protein